MAKRKDTERYQRFLEQEQHYDEIKNKTPEQRKEHEEYEYQLMQAQLHPLPEIGYEEWCPDTRTWTRIY